MSVAEEFVDPNPLLYVTSWSWQNGTEQRRVRKAKVPGLVAQFMRFGVDFSVTRNP